MENSEKIKYAAINGLQKLSKNAGAVLSGVYAPMAFIGGGVYAFGSFSPMPMAFIAVSFLKGARFYIVAFASLLGYVFLGAREESVKYVAAVMLAVIFNIVMERLFDELDMPYKAFMAGVCVMAGGILLAIAKSGSSYVLFSSGMEALMVFGLSLVMKSGSDVILGGKKRRALSGDEIFGLSVFMGLTAAAFGSVGQTGDLLKTLAAAFCVVITAQKAGGGAGAATGASISLMLMICGSADGDYFVALTLSGMFAGLFKDYGKALCSAGLMLGFLFFCISEKFSAESVEFLKGAVIACALFMLTPKDCFAFLEGIGASDGDRYYIRMKAALLSSLDEFANVFSSLAYIMEKDRGKQKSSVSKEAAEAAKEVYYAVCANCGLKSDCWETNEKETLLALHNGFKKRIATGELCFDDISAGFAKRCAKIGAVAETLSYNCERRKKDVIRDGKLAESRILASRLFKAACEMSKTIAEELDIKKRFRSDIENDLKAAMEREGIKGGEVSVESSLKGELKVYVDGVFSKEGIEKLTVAASKAAGRKFRKLSEGGFTKGVKLVEAGKLRATADFSFKTADGQTVSGDNYSYTELKNGSMLVALSDGMGTGERAAEESKAAVELMERLADTGFRGSTSVELINSLLMLKSDRESFATLDICFIDLYSGKARFVKSGAAPSFIIRDRRVAAARSDSLPAGIISGADADSFEGAIKNGDVIIMATDGAFENVVKSGISEEKWLESIFADFWSNNPKDLTDYIIKKALSLSGGVATDDMTVIAVRIWESL